MEKLGIPSVTVATEPFLTLAKAVAAAEGVPDACMVTVPHPLGMVPEAQVIKKADDAFPEILRMLTDWRPSAEVTKEKAAYPAEKFEFTGTIEEMNRLFFIRGWSLGLPIIPPTPEQVGEMLRGTNRQPDEVLGQVPPKMGTLTVELAAVHAAMAGCQRQYMPVLIAALEAFLSPEVNWRGSLATTGTSQFLIMVNGPVIKEIGIGYEQGPAGKGYHANGSIGYAINLISYVVGGSRPPKIDRSTLASPGDYVCWVFGENEEALPAGWEPLHVERGFKKSDSVVTVMCSYPPVENIDHWSTSAVEHLRWWRYIVSPMHNIGGPCNPWTMKQNPVLAVGPEHAQLVAGEGWSKSDLRKAFWEQVRMPASAWPSSCATKRESLEEIFGDVTAETAIPVTLTPEQLLIVIAGGDGKHSHYFPPFPGSMPVSRLVRA